MTITRRVGFYGKIATLWVVMVITLLFLSLGALCLFIAAFLIWLIHCVGPAAAAALTGLLLLLAGGGVFFGFRLALNRLHAKQPRSGGNLLGLASLALRMVNLTIRRSPRKTAISAALFILAAISGVVIDYFMSRKDSKK